MPLDPYLRFDRAAWSARRGRMTHPLSRRDLDNLRGRNIPMDLREIEEVFVPMSRLLRLLWYLSKRRQQNIGHFLGREDTHAPFVIGLAGSVAVGKSTTARVLQALMSGWHAEPRVELVTTDGFLHPNRVLEARGILHRKGFPESYDRARLLAFIEGVKAGEPELRTPVYSHLSYDVLDDELRLERPDILILEGLNVLQTGDRPGRPWVSDFFDVSIYLDADPADLRRWYVERFLALRDTAFRDPASYFHRYAELDDRQAEDRARRIWSTINEVNLMENILPTRERAMLVLHKGRDHGVDEVWLRRR